MEERTVPCSVLLIGENPSDTAALERSLGTVRPNTPVTIARHLQDVARSLSACGLGAFRVAFFFPNGVDDAELLTTVRSSPGGGSTRLVVLLHDELADDTKPFYQRGAHSVVRWPRDLSSQDQISETLIRYWEDLNLPVVANAVRRESQVALL